MNKNNKRAQSSLLTVMAVFMYFANSLCCYQGVYLQKAGISASGLGLINTVTNLAVIVAMSVWGTVSDRSGSLKKVLIPVTAAGFLSYGLIPLISDRAGGMFWVFLIYIPLVRIFLNPMNSLNENLIVRDCAEMSLNYGVIRSVGALTYSLGGFAAVWILNRLGIQWTFYIPAILAVPVILLILPIRDPGAEAASEDKPLKEDRRAQYRMLWANRAFLIFIAYIFVQMIACGCVDSFLPYIMDASGAGSENYGLFLGVTALCEIPAMLLLSRLHARFHYRALLMIGTGLMTVACVFFAIASGSVVPFILGALVQGLGNGLWITSSYNYVYELAPENLKATAQAAMTIALSVAGILANAVGGVLYDTMSARRFCMVLIIIFAASIGLLAVRVKETD